MQLCGLEKIYICNHVIAVAFELNFFERPSLKLDKEGKRGASRPKKNKTAMSRATTMVLNERLYPDISNIPEQPASSSIETTKKRKSNVRKKNLNE